LSVNREQLKSFFKDKKYVIAAYLFGSHAGGRVSPLSDVDIGVLFDETLSKKLRLKLKLDLLGELSKLLKSDKVDLVVMNDASISLNYEIINGEVLFERDRVERVFFESKILAKYLDRRYYDKRSLDAFLEI